MSIETSDDGTRPRIIDLVEALIMERGFNAISYADVAEKIGIRKASIHYHFPSKADLGLAVIARYVAKLEAAATPIAPLRGSAFSKAFDGFLSMFAAVASSSNQVCLGGVLGAEFETLPQPMQAEVRRFYRTAQSYLGDLLEAGRRDGAFAFEGASAPLARSIMSALEGALIIGRALGEAEQIATAMSAARRLIGLRD
jgi:TetR/AcrR family transcriptional repressor of nem operon